jgi:TctA family transporter
VLYLLGSALTLATSRPWRWLGGGVVGYFFLNAFRGLDATEPIADTLNAVLTGRYGLTTLLTGLVENAYVGHKGFALVPDAGAWLTAAFLWLAAALSLFLWSAYRQPEG